MDAGCGQLEYVEEVMGCGFLTAATKFGLQPEWLTGIVGEIPVGMWIIYHGRWVWTTWTI